jgi:phosphatidylglycerol---prolipoprotein diacylglyceryl transferase
MTFPVYVTLVGRAMHPHFLFEGLGYLAGSRLYFALRRRQKAEALPLETNLWLLVGCIFGAWLGSKVLAWAESPGYYWALRHDLASLLGGKTIVGGLLGGWAGIELAKKKLGLTRSTGDPFVYPLAVGTAIGRLGCFFTGLSDHTYGTATTLPWGVDFGDGINRHPTQLYEIGYVLALAGTLYLFKRRHRLASGTLFRFYFTGYFLFRFTIEFIKPRESLMLGLSAIQCASLAGAVLALVSLARPTPINHCRPTKISHGSPLPLR